MLEIEYSATINMSFLENIAEEFSNSFGKKVAIKDNALVFPSDLAEGKFEFYSNDTTIGVCIMDCRFFDDIKFMRQSVKVNDFHALTFNLSAETAFTHVKEDDFSLALGDWKGIFYGASAKGIGWIAPKNEDIRIVMIFFTRTWLMKQYKIDQLEENYRKDLPLDKTFQMALDLDLVTLLIVHDVLTTQAPAYMPRLFYEGYAQRLIALTMRRLFFPSDNKPKLKYKEVSDILTIKERIEDRLTKSLPSLEDLALECQMSKSKFTGLFKSIYGKSYIDFFNDIKMQKAVELLMKGMRVADVANAVGYSNISHFTRVFKGVFKTTPKSYQIENKDNY